MATTHYTKCGQEVAQITSNYMKPKNFKPKKLKMFAVYSCWGFHAFYQTELLAKKHWKNNKKAEIYYQIFPCEITYTIEKPNK